MTQTSFRIRYENPRLCVPQLDIFEGHDFDTAIYDHLECGANATLAIGSYELNMTGAKFADLLTSSLRMAELLTALPVEASEDFGDSLPDIPPQMKVYAWLFPHFMLWLPVIIFATNGKDARIYTRTMSEVRDGPRFIMKESDREAPTIVPLAAVIEELRKFVVGYLDDIVEAMPSIVNDEKYQEYRRRITAIGAHEATSRPCSADDSKA